jgi:hypothetical protein
VLTECANFYRKGDVTVTSGKIEALRSNLVKLLNWSISGSTVGSGQISRKSVYLRCAEVAHRFRQAVDEQTFFSSVH